MLPCLDLKFILNHHALRHIQTYQSMAFMGLPKLKNGWGKSEAAEFNSLGGGGGGGAAIFWRFFSISKVIATIMMTPITAIAAIVSIPPNDESPGVGVGLCLTWKMNLEVNLSQSCN